MTIERIPYDQYYEHCLDLNEREEILQEELLPEIPEVVFDIHVHSAGESHYEPEHMPQSVRGHMMSTFPVTTLEHSAKIDELLMPGKEVRKARFAHAYAGIDHFAVTEYLIEESPDKDAVFAFGRSDTEDEIQRTLEDLDEERVKGLKMYYLANGIAKSDLYDYFPPAILEKAQEVGVPIVLHLPHSLYASHDEVIELAERYPRLNIILAHMGVAHVPRSSLPDILSRFSEHTNIYVDTSQVHDRELLRSAIIYLGVDRIMFGTDEPLNLLRSVIYENPRLGPRILTDFPYHWVDRQEYEEFKNVAQGEFVHSHWQQLQAILQAIKLAIHTQRDQERAKEDIFFNNAQRLLEP